MIINNNSKPVTGSVPPVNSELQKANEIVEIKEKAAVKTDKLDISFSNEKSKDALISKVGRKINEEVAEEIKNQDSGDEAQKIEAIKAQLQNGTYPIDTMAIAKNMLMSEDF